MRTIFVNPARSRARRKRRKNAPRPWASLYAKKYGALSKRKKRKSRRKPKASHNKAARKRHSKKTLKRTRKAGNPMARHRRSHRRSRRRSRRRNAGITPFIQNPMARYSNPRRGLRRRRKNPGLSLPSLTLNGIVKKSLTYGGGAAIGTFTNIFALNKISNHWLRNGARILVGCAGAPMLGGSLGAAAAGALFAPLVTELAVALKLPGIATEADLEADLQDLLDDMDEGEESGVPMNEADLW